MYNDGLFPEFDFVAIISMWFRELTRQEEYAFLNASKGSPDVFIVFDIVSEPVFCQVLLKRHLSDDEISVFLHDVYNRSVWSGNRPEFSEKEAVWMFGEKIMNDP